MLASHGKTCSGEHINPRETCPGRRMLGSIASEAGEETRC